EVEIALNSHFPEVHDMLTKTKNSFKQTLKGIRQLMQNGVRTNIRIIVNKQNYQHLVSFAQFIWKNLPGVNRIVFIYPRFKGKAKLYSDKLAVKFTELMPFVHDACKELLQKEKEIQLLHFPYCMLDKSLWEKTLKNPYGININQCKHCDYIDECPKISESYIEKFGNKEFIPINNRHKDVVDIQLTDFCNYNCLFCCRPPKKTNNPTIEEIQNKIVDLTEKGYRRITLTGGEPLLRKDLIDIIRFAKQRNIINFDIQTNGMKFSDEELVKEIANEKIGTCHLAFPSHKKEIYEQLTQVKGSYEVAKKALDNLCKNNVDIKMVNVMNSLNKDHLPEYIRYFHENYNITKFNLLPIQPVGNPEQYEWIVPKFSEFKENLRNALEYAREHNLELSVSEGMPLCYLRGFEELSAVTELGLKNISIWDNFINSNHVLDFNKSLYAKEHKGEVCKNCSLNEICGGVWPQYKDWFGTDELEALSKNPNAIIESITKKEDKEFPIIQELRRFPDFGQNNEEKEVIDILPEIYGLLAGAKRGIAHVTPVYSNIYKKIQSYCTKLGLKVSHSNFKIVQSKNDKCIPFDSKEGTKYDTMYIFITKDNETMEEMKKVWDNYPLLYNSEITEKPSPLTVNKLCADLVGYPECCVKEYNKIQSKGQEHPDRLHVENSIKNSDTFSYLLNNFRWDAPYYLVSHFPCSYNCEKSKKIAKRVLEYIKIHHNDYYKKLVKFLKSPIIYVDFHSIFSFEDYKAEGNKIHYKTIYSQLYDNVEAVINSAYGDSELYKLHKNNQGLLLKGNIVAEENNKLVVYKDNKKVGELFASKKYNPKIIRFAE
ncbi:MAG: radical SAM protein, partial [Nanoarchaeota archaeon]